MTVKTKAVAASRMPAHRIDIAPLPAAWKKSLPKAAALARKAAVIAIEDGRVKLPARERKRHGGVLEVSIVPASDAVQRRLNRTYRGQDKATNVLSFPAGPEALPLLGDVVIALATLRREARSENKALAAHFTHLVVHGVLHLLGYDHLRDKQAAQMEHLESAIMSRLGYPDPYALPPRTAAPR